MKKKCRILFLIAGVCLVGLFAIRVYFVNRNAPVLITKEYAKGETVPFGKDYTASESHTLDGYSIKILDSEVLSVDNFRKKYHLTEEDLKGQYSFTNAYYVIKAKFANVDNQAGTDNGVSLLDLMLMGKNYMVLFDSISYQLLNPKMPIGGGFSLRPGTEKTVYLTYAMLSGNAPGVKELRENPPKLQITEAPTRKLLDLK